MIEAILHAFLLALGLILPLGAQNIFVLTKGPPNHNSLKHYQLLLQLDYATLYS